MTEVRQAHTGACMPLEGDPDVDLNFVVDAHRDYPGVMARDLSSLGVMGITFRVKSVGLFHTHTHEGRVVVSGRAGHTTSVGVQCRK